MEGKINSDNLMPNRNKGEIVMEMDELIKECLKKDNVFAVVGASRNPKKYGYKVYKDLKNSGYKVYPINPKADEVLGDKSYPNLEKLPEIPDVVNIVVPPKITEKIAVQCNKLGIKKVWMQPGSESKESIRYCEKHGISVIHDVCIMVEMYERRQNEKFNGRNKEL